jgi:hypothetical protein
MTADFASAFAALKNILEGCSSRMAVTDDTPAVYSLTSRKPSRYPQHKGQPMWFGSVRLGKAYVSFHLMPLYMNPPLLSRVSPALKKRMQGKTCFNFKAAPDAELLDELKRLVEAALKDWSAKQYL